MSLSPPRSNPVPKKLPILSFSDNEPDPNESFSESSAPESSDGEFMNNLQAQHLWENSSLSNFGLVCASTASDSEFDRLNNKLLIALKDFSSANEIFCFKCKAMKLMTKRGKAKNTYQFACGTHTLSATQILGTLPDSFILRNLPTEPRHVFNETISWLGKDQLSPELQELSSKRNAVKRFSAHRSPMKPVSSSLLTSRNAMNELLVELRDLKERVTSNEIALRLQKDSNAHLVEINSGLTEQIKLLREENEILKHHLRTPSPAPKAQMYTSTTKTSLSYANATNIIKPVNRTMKFYTQAAAKGPTAPLEVISASTSSKPPTTKEEFSPLKVVVFKGCHRKSINTYKKMLPNIGFEAHWARHVVFLAEDILQITTFECKVDLLIKGMQSISSDVKHLSNFDPFAGSSYADYGTFTDESASKGYLTLMKQCAKRLQADAQKSPSLRRISNFISKVVEEKNIIIKPASRATRIFCLGDFIIQKAPVEMAMDVEPQEPTSITVNNTTPVTDEIESEIVMEASPTQHDQ